MDNKTNQVQLRFSDSQLLYIDKAHQHYQKDNDEIITRSEFMRRMIMISCAMELGDISFGDVPEPVKYDCPCVEVHTCGKEKVDEN